MRLSAMISFILLSVGITSAADADCRVSQSVLKPLRTSLAPVRERHANGVALEHLFAKCPAGPSDHPSRAIFFRYVDSLFSNNDILPYPDPEEAAYEGATQAEYDLQQYMNRIVNEGDAEFAPVILKVAKGQAISRLGPAAKYDVLRIANVAAPTTVGAGRHSPYVQALAAIGYWIDPGESRFATDEKREMTSLLLSKLSPYAGRSLIGQPYQVANSLLTALAHSDSPEVMKVLQDWSANPSTSLRDEAAKSCKSVQARLAQADR